MRPCGWWSVSPWNPWPPRCFTRLETGSSKRSGTSARPGRRMEKNVTCLEKNLGNMMRKPWKNHHFEAIGLVIDTSLETCWTCNVNAGLSGLDVRNLRISWPNNLGIKFCRGEWEKLRLQETKNQKKTDLTLPRYRAQETFWIIMHHHIPAYVHMSLLYPFLWSTPQSCLVFIIWCSTLWNHMFVNGPPFQSC